MAMQEKRRQRQPGQQDEEEADNEVGTTQNIKKLEVNLL